MPATVAPPSKGRVAWVDYAKGIGIILVVVGHTLRGFEGTPIHVPGWQAVDAWIYAFHMPLFFFLAGLFLEPSTKAPFGAFVAGKMRRILWPYLVWSLLQEGFRNLGGADALSASQLWTIAYKPVMQFWFLYVLFVLLVAYAAWRKTGASWQLFVAAAFALNLSLSFGANYGPWGVIYQTLLNAPYLALGIAAGCWTKRPTLGSLSNRALITISVGGYGLLAALVAAGIPKPAAVPVAAIGICASSCLAILLARASRYRWVDTLGIMSLEIFVAHTIFSSGLREILLRWNITDAAVHTAGGIAIGLIAPVILRNLCQRFGLGIAFAFPSPRRA
jgi:fucose 4-O-acetylase-like acetyltransferase